MNRISTPITRMVILLFVLAFLSFDQGSKDFYRVPNLINVTDVEIDRDHPAFFNFSFEKGDVINVNIQKVWGVRNRVEIGDLSLKVRNLSKAETEPFKVGRDFKIKNKGEYSIEISSSKRRDINVSVIIEVSPGKKYEAGKTYEILKARSLYIGNSANQSSRNQPRFSFNFKKDDKVTISSSSNGAPALKFMIVELGDLHAVSAGSPITIPDDGDYTFRFFVEAEDGKPWLQRLFGADQDGIPFNDLVISRQVFKAPPSGGGSNSPTQELEELLAESGVDVNAEEGSDPIADAFNSMQELIATLTEEKVDSALQAGGELFEDEYELAPKMNLDLAPNRKCVPLEDLNFGQVPPIIWVYWIGVTDESNFLYQSLSERFEQRYGRDLMEFYSQTLKKRDWNYKKDGAFIPLRSAVRIKENVEYAIVDIENKINFETGLPYRAMANGNFIFQDKNVKTDYGNGFIPGGETFLCMCNHNRMSPVKVHFKFQNFAYLPSSPF